MPSLTPVAVRLRARDIGIVIALYLISFLFLAGFPHPQIGFPLDDSWIHQVVARNLAHDGTLGFIPGVRSSGSSSLLWSFLLAANWKFLPSISPVIYAGVLSGFLILVTGVGLFAMARRDDLSESSCWIWALAPALNGNFMWLGVIGMEHVLFVALSVVGIYLWFQRSMRSAFFCALCLGALSLTRPEGLALAVFAILACRWAKRSQRDVLLLTGIVGVCFLLSLTANFVTSRSWLPTTYAGRKWLYFGSDKIPLHERIEFPWVIARNILHPWFIHQTHALYVLSAVVLVLMAVGQWRLFRERRPSISFLCLWSYAHIAIYTLMLPARSHGGRYQPLFLALSFPLLFLGVETVMRRLTASRQRSSSLWLQSAVMAVCVALGFCSLKVWRTVTADGIAVIESSHAKMGQYLVTSLPAGSKVAAFDIGRIGFLYGGRLADLGGLTDSSFLPYLRDHRLMEYLSERKIPYFVWPSNQDDSSQVGQIFVITPEIRQTLTKVVHFCAPMDAWSVSYEATSAAAPCQTLYQLNSSK